MAASRPEAAPAVPEAVEAAESVGLHYVRDRGPGIGRRRSGRGFIYLRPDRGRITDEEQIQRLNRLAIPPAWRDVWISPDPRGHLQATGRDARGRKQYRYHPRWRAVRDETKYERMLGFGEALPALRRRLERDLSLPRLPRAKVLATVVRLLDRTFIRVGNEEYARENRSYGLTTLRTDHVDVSGSTVRFQFRGKGGKTHEAEVDDRRVARVVRHCQELPGQELFQYVDEAGERQTIDSADVNAYVREASGQDFTAKDFRTWGGTVLAARELQEMAPEDAGKRKKNITAAIRKVANELGNRPATCRKYYVHPAIVDAYLDGSLSTTFEHFAALPANELPSGLSANEAAVLTILRDKLEQEDEEAK